MNRKTLALFFFLSYAAAHSAAEATRLPFFTPDAVYTESPQAFPSFASWAEFSHTLNQKDAGDTAQYLDTGSILTFWSNDRIAVSGIFREVLQFRASPIGDWYFWTRALVTDIRLETTVSLSPFDITAGYRHDCKHDAGPVVRDVIHDAFYARVGVTVTRFADFGLECEANLPTVFQAGPEEPDQFRASAEAKLVPVASSNGTWRTFIDVRSSLIVRERSERVAVKSSRDVDWLARVGGDFRAGYGSLRLFYSLERISDDWADLDPIPQTVSALHLLFVFNTGDRGNAR